jgi:hypothetical protein
MQDLRLSRKRTLGLGQRRHIVLQRSAMEDVGRVALGLEPAFPTF